MKGKSKFTKQEIDQIVSLINQKVKASPQQQKKIREKIRALGFYASDYGLGGGYTSKDFLRIIGKPTKSVAAPTISINSKKQNTISNVSESKRKSSDENYILNLCDGLLKRKSSRQHRFDFLRGDTGMKLPVDAWYQELNLVIEYRERQHTEMVTFFDKKVTASGITRDKQRKLYDQRRREVLPKHGIQLIELDYHLFPHSSSKRLDRIKEKDLEVLKKKLRGFI